MKRSLATDDVTRLVRSAERLVRLAQTISEQTQEVGAQQEGAPIRHDPGWPAPDHGADRPDAHLVDAARQAIRAHREQPDFGIPTLFHSRAWILMLELYIAERCGIDTPVKAACLTLGGAQTTALRCILDLERADLLKSVADDKDARRRLLRLAPAAHATLRAFLAQQAARHGKPMRIALRIAKQGMGDASSAAHQAGADARIAPISGRSANEADPVLQ